MTTQIGRTPRAALAAVLAVGLSLAAAYAAQAEFASHRPMRPLPQPSERPLAEGPAYYVDAARGDDANDGSAQRPWGTIIYALTQLKPGDTLVLRGGVYYENVIMGLRGEEGRPITVRSHPGELAIVDAGYREFLENPAEAWEPYPGGTPGEFRSTQSYPALGEGTGRRGVPVVGNFGDSMIPLHGYNGWTSTDRGNPMDMRAAPAEYEGIGGKDKEQGIYCGPGVWLDGETLRVHVRLAHTVFEGLDDRNYSGETDPRNLPLVIGGRLNALLVENAAHVRIQDIAFRGTRTATVRVQNSRQIEFDGVHVYGGSPAFSVEGTDGLRIVHSAIRSVSAPWSNRASEKYRGLSAYLFVAGRRNRDFTMAWSEFSDSHDGLIIGSIHGLRFHNNRVDNFNDDGLYLTTGYPPGRDIHIYQNLVSRCLGSFSFAGRGAGQEETIAYIHRNVFDLREPINRGFARFSDAQLLLSHGSPQFMPMLFYHNTVILPDSSWRGHYGAGLSQRGIGAVHQGEYRREILNNIFMHVQGMPGLQFFYGAGDEWPEETKLVADYNLHWGFLEGPEYEGDFFAARRRQQRRQPDWWERSKEVYEPGWTANDLFADPKFAAFTPDLEEADDFRLDEESPAVGAGVPLAEDWPDPFRPEGEAAPDIGAVPFGAEPWRVGIRGRIPAFGPEGEGRYPQGYEPRPLH